MENNNFAVARRSALQIIDHVAQIDPHLLGDSSIKLVAELDFQKSLPTSSDGDAPDFLTSTTEESSTLTTLLDAVSIHNQSPLRLFCELAQKSCSHRSSNTPATTAVAAVAADEENADDMANRKATLPGSLAFGKTIKTLLVCMCDPDMPGAYWTMAGPAADADEVDLMASSSLFTILKDTKRIPTVHEALLVENAWIFRPSEGAKLNRDPIFWHSTALLLAPFLPNTSSTSTNNVTSDTGDASWPANGLARQFRLMLEVAMQHKFEQLILPLGRWARANGNALEITLRLTQALETIKKTSTKLKILISCPPEQSHWQHSVQSTINSAKTRITEQKINANTTENDNINNNNNNNTAPSTGPVGRENSGGAFGLRHDDPSRVAGLGQNNVFDGSRQMATSHRPFTPTATNSVFTPLAFESAAAASTAAIAAATSNSAQQQQPQILRHNNSNGQGNVFHNAGEGPVLRNGRGRGSLQRRDGFRRSHHRRDQHQRSSWSDRLWNAPQKIWARVTGNDQTKKH